ncbi:hypothetical protein [Mesorhizobium humile]|uniref:Uncharacterized protein n=1 Tax=Mesorhizobium humile TaxID=3072313 RepID=A0ABU4YPH1_9HYPH|nr:MULTISPECIES: hypothetical protein [unclassified Mesorhizobium]MDX8457905.1 hypothetical protein [Mesorhizobium sp. VK2D]MDX8487985.1 hypothetical protein [Mesorhizobium sp. VK2B]
MKPVGIPAGADPRSWRQAIEQQLNDPFDRATALITALDVMEADCDLEDGADAAPWLGWGERGPKSVSSVFTDGRGSSHCDRELEDEHGGDIQDEPHDEEEREGDHADMTARLYRGRAGPLKFAS